MTIDAVHVHTVRPDRVRPTAGWNRILVTMLAALSLVLASSSVDLAHASGQVRWVDAAAATAGQGSGCGSAAGYASIGSAVSAAISGDTITICPGTYQEDVTVLATKGQLTLRSTDPTVDAVVAATTVVSSGAPGEDVFSLRSSGVVIDGLSIENTSRYGVYFRGNGQGGAVRNSVIASSGAAGIRSDHDGVELTDLEILGGSQGIFVQGRHNLIEDVAITGASDNGIRIAADDNTVRASSVAESGLEGIFVRRGAGNRIESSTVTSSGASGVRLWGPENAIVGSTICGQVPDIRIQSSLDGPASIANQILDTRFDTIQDAGTGTVVLQDRRCEPEPEPEPLTKDVCKGGGWSDHGFRNQGLCIQFVNTGHDSR